MVVKTIDLLSAGSRRIRFVGCLRHLTTSSIVAIGIASIYVMQTYFSIHSLAGTIQFLMKCHSTTSRSWTTPTAWLMPQLSGTQNSDFAYVFLLGSVDPESSWYRGYLWNMFVSSQILRDSNSTADRIAMIHLQPAARPTEEFLETIQKLEQLDVRIWWLPTELVVTKDGAFHNPFNVTNTTENGQDDDNPQKLFDQANMHKFRVLQLTTYKRLLYMDSDMIPMCNLDYIFDMSIAGEIAPNLGIADGNEPTNGGFFMVHPKQGDYEHIQQIIRRQKESAKDLPSPHFDIHQGWGHAITGNDRWYSTRGEGQKWDFYAAQSDQGLLYHWLKYVTKDVSFLIFRSSHTIYERWGANQYGNLTRITHSKDSSRHPFTNRTCLGPDVAAQRWRNLKFANHPAYQGAKLRHPPFSDFIHFYGHFKPWNTVKQVNETYPETASKTDCSNSVHYWFQVLRAVSQHLDLKIDFDDWKHQIDAPPFGDGRVAALESR